MNRQWLEKRVTSNLDREFPRRTPPRSGRGREDQKPRDRGVRLLSDHALRSDGEVTGHLLGFTNREDGRSGSNCLHRSLAGLDARSA